MTQQASQTKINSKQIYQIVLIAARNHIKVRELVVKQTKKYFFKYFAILVALMAVLLFMGFKWYFALPLFLIGFVLSILLGAQFGMIDLYKSKLFQDNYMPRQLKQVQQQQIQQTKATGLFPVTPVNRQKYQSKRKTRRR